MKVIVAFFIAICLNAAPKVYAQTVNLNEKNASLESIFKKITRQTNYHFVFTKELLKKSNKVTIQIKNMPFNEALKQVFLNQPLDYTVYDSQVIIKDRDTVKEAAISVNIQEQETYVINGTVSDEKGEPLPGATVFITNSQNAGPTDETGKFTLAGLQPGTYEVVVQILGFGVHRQFVTIQKKNVSLRVKLKEDVIALNTVNITALSNSARKKYLKYFIKYFIGESDNASKCKLLNPEAVNLSYDKKANVLEASSDKFLIVENKSLGYEVHYLLTSFKMDVPNQLLSYDGSLYFKELQGSRSQLEKWQKNRQSTYEGSIWHFFKAAFNNTLTKEGFLVYKLPDVEALDKIKNTNFKKIVPLDNTDTLFTKVNENFKLFNLYQLKRDVEELYVVYTKKDEPYKYTKSVGTQIVFRNTQVSFDKNRSEQLPFTIPSSRRQVTIIHPVLDSMLFDRNGNINSEKSILPRGYWSWERIADVFPADFNAPGLNQQKIPLVNEIKAIVNTIDTLRSNLPAEKLYLQTDKPYYAPGDTLRFKAYLLDADFLEPSTRSGLLYVELDDASNKAVKRIMAPLASGVSWGDIALDEKDFPQGSYTLRAYTNWMRNFGEDHIFKKNIYISPLSSPVLVKAGFKLQNQGRKDNVQASLRFTGSGGGPLRLADMLLRVKSGNKTLYRDKAVTGIDGSMEVNFDLPDKTAIKNLSIQAQNISKGADTTTLIIPVDINSAENTDVQFMPEGGNMVVGIPARIGFKAVSEDGRGAAITGAVYNSKQQEVALFRSTHKGMGSFELTPEAGESYVARVTLPGNSSKNYPLPAVNLIGTALKLTTQGKDSLEITLSASTELINSPAAYYLIGQARGVVCYASLVSFKQGVIRRAISKGLFPTGITRFTLLSADKLPLNERMVYIDHNDNLQFTINTDKQGYIPRDSIALAIAVKDAAGKPVQGTFSLAVTDDSQVKTDSTAGNMLNNLLFTADLKGTIEDPGYYFESDNNTPDGHRDNNSNKAIDLDNLLLTQGWIGYDWKQVFNTKNTEPIYAAEPEFIVQGKVTNVLNKPVEKSKVLLFSRKPELIRDTVTDKEGRFIFKGLFPVDTAEFKIQARNRVGQSFNVGIEMLNGFKPPVFAAAAILQTPRYVNIDTVLLNNNSTNIAQLKAEVNLPDAGYLLNEVVIKEKKIIPDSHNLNGPGEADQTFDEQDMLKAGKMSLEKFLEKNIKGFNNHGGNWLQGASLPISYVLYGKMVHFVIDGIDINQLFADYDLGQLSGLGPIKEPDRRTFLAGFLDKFTAEDVKGVEIMYNSKYNSAYNARILATASLNSYGDNIAYIEITTRAGKGPYAGTTTGTYLYKPLPFTLPKQFYRPRYTVNNSNTAIGTDLRSTIHWEPDIITDKDGKAVVSFYSADKPSTYTIIMEGTDLNGNIGYKRQQIKISSKSIAAK